MFGAYWRTLIQGGEAVTFIRHAAQDRKWEDDAKYKTGRVARFVRSARPFILLVSKGGLG